MAAPFNVTIIAMASSVFYICFHPIDEMLDFLVSILNVANNGLFNDSKWSIKDIQDFRQVGATKGCWKYFYPTDWYFRNFWHAPVWNTPNAVIQRNGNLGNSIFVHFEMTFWTMYPKWDFDNLIFQTVIFSQFKLGKKSTWIFQTGECQKFLKSQCR